MASNTASTSSNSSGKSYSLVGKNLKLTSEQDVQPYIDEIGKIDGLEEIHLGGNTLGVGACQALGRALEKQKSLRIADFADIFTGRLISEIPDALRALCDSLVGHTSLVELDLSDNAFGGRSAEPMVNFITHNHHFSVLKLNNNGLGVTGGQIVANALFAAAEELDKQGKPSQLKTVICGRNRLEDGSAPYWAKAFAAHKTLEEVRMFQNGIRMDGIIALAQGLAACPNLRVLDIQDNTATVRGSRGIAAVLPQWPHLETLNLSDCLLKPRGGFAVITALSKGKNTSLKTLQLQYCDLDRKALGAIGAAIDEGALKNLEKLDVNGNWADEEDDCIEKIKKALEKHGHDDALDELDEMDPEGEDDEEEEEEEQDDSDADDSKHDLAAGAAVAAGAGAASGAAMAGMPASLAGAGTNSDKSAEAAPVSDAAAKEPAPVPGAQSKSDVDDKSGWASKAENEQAPYEPQDAQASKHHATGEAVAGGAAAAAVGGAAAGAAATSHQSSSTSEPSQKQAANDAAAVADSAREVPEEKEAASNAAEVAQSAQEVPEEKEAATNAAEVAESARQVPESKAGQATASTSAAAKSSAETDEDKLTSAMAKTSIADNEGQGVAQSDSMDLSGELYGQDSTKAAGQTAAQDEQEGQGKKTGFRAALGAVRELLR